MLALFSTPAPVQGASGAENYTAVMRSFGVWEPETQERFDFSVWYPGRAAAVEFVQEGWVINSAKRGRIAPGYYPIVLISHDTAGSRFANSDLAVSLARAGMIVISPTHTGDSQAENNGIYTAKLLADRPHALLRALETVLENQDVGIYADTTRIGLVGVGFGCISVLQLLGLLPDFSTLEGYCEGKSPEEGFCSPWAAKRLARMPAAMLELAGKKGNTIFTPNPTWYMLAGGPPTPEAKRGSSSLSAGEMPKSRPWWKELFDWGEEEETSPELPPVLSSELSAPPAEPDDDKGFGPALPPILDIQGGPLFGWADSGGRFVKIPAPDLPEPAEKDVTRASANPDVGALSKAPSPAIPQTWKFPSGIRALAFLTPAGGMLFNPEKLRRVNIPTALVEAGKDRLYPPAQHSQSYISGLPRPPQILRVEEADHFSFFARCSQDTAAALGGTCGAIPEDERAKIARQRDQFLVAFFQSALEGPPPADKAPAAANPKP
jgi:predicted dienelactone hydrolase